MRRSQAYAVHSWTAGRVLIVQLANAPVNALSAGVRKGLLSSLESAASDSTIDAVVITGDGRFFSAGADIAELTEAEEPPTMDAIIDSIERMLKPVVAALNGAALGGGFELALACHYRVASEGAEVALPEVRLGLIPGLGGTQRLPRIVDLSTAVDIIVSGRRVGKDEVVALGIAEPLSGAGADFLRRAVEFARKTLTEPLDAAGKLPRARDWPVRLTVGTEPTDVLDTARATVRIKQRGFCAPLRAIDATEGAIRLSFEDALIAERRLFEECLVSVEAAALTHLFRAERTARTLSGPSTDTPVPAIDRAAVIGGGTMGRGIAIALILAGVDTKLIERDGARLDGAMGAVNAYLDKLVTRGQWSPARRGDAQSRLSGSLMLSDIGGADVVIEAVYEDLELKTRLFREIDRVAGSSAILATNTSGLDVDVIAAATSRPQQVVGLHFFSPAHIMRLVEVVRGRLSGPSALQASIALARRMQKIPVVARVCDGFIGNRIFDAYWREAEFMVEEGASPEQVDGALVEFGMAMGPFSVSDLAGLDIGHAIRTRHSRQLPDGVRLPGVEEYLFQRSRLGQKNGHGWYDYDERGRHPGVGTHALIAEYRRALGSQTRPFSDEEIVTRCISALVNEAATVLQEGIAERASDIDLVAVHGYGFPAYRGGPMFYAKTIGPEKIASIVRSHASGPHRHWWQPSHRLLRVAADHTAGRPVLWD